jgi:hypothetical protein
MTSTNEGQAYSTNPTDTQVGSKSKSETASQQSAGDLAGRAMQHTASWKPSFNRRQSWSQEDQKHEMTLGNIGGVSTGPGFSERK